MTYAIRFDFPDADAPAFAGDHKGAAGFAPSLATAKMFDDADKAAAYLTNAYGQATLYGRVVTVRAGYPAAAMQEP